MHKLTLTIIGILFASYAYSQEYVRMMQSKTANFYEIQEAFNKYWENKSYERGKGWKQFKRWEYLMESRVDENGNFPDGLTFPLKTDANALPASLPKYQV